MAKLLSTVSRTQKQKRLHSKYRSVFCDLFQIAQIETTTALYCKILNIVYGIPLQLFSFKLLRYMFENTVNKTILNLYDSIVHCIFVFYSLG